METTSTDSNFDGVLRLESIRAVRYGAFYAQFVVAAALTAVSVLAIATGVPLASVLPLMLFLAGVIFLLSITHQIARRGTGTNMLVLYGCLLLIVCTPSLFLIVMNSVREGGTASFYVGPVVMAHFPMLALTGLFFNLRFSVLCGFSAAALHFIAFLIARNELQLIQSPNTELLRILQQDGPNTMRAFILFFTGIITGVVSVYARRLLSRIVSESEEKDRINRIFGEYVSEEVREKVTQESLSAAGHRGEAAVLFSDIRGFTSLSEQLEPEQLVEQLNEYFDEMVGVIARNRGVVDKFIGDAIMATFGAVAELEQPCDAALRAAREMQTGLNELNERFRARGKPELRIGIGMHYADILQGVVGSRTRKEYTVMGDGVNIAARLEALTKKAGTPTLFSREFLEQLTPAERESPDIRKLGRLKLRGRSEDTYVYGLGGSESYL